MCRLRTSLRIDLLQLNLAYLFVATNKNVTQAVTSRSATNGGAVWELKERAPFKEL